MHGVPAIATSLAEENAVRNYGSAAEEVLGVARRVKQYGLPPNTFLNVNIPAPPANGYRGYRITTQAMQKTGEERFAEMAHPSGRTVYWNVYKEGGTGPDGTDVRAVEEGYVSVTPMKLGETDAAQFEALRAIFK
jgi:5'-nucleotidase